MRTEATFLALLVGAFGCDVVLTGEPGSDRTGDTGGTTAEPDASVPENAPPNPGPPADTIATTSLDVARATDWMIVDGDLSEFSGSQRIVLTIPDSGATATYRLRWDHRALYIGLEVSDAILHADNTADGSLWQDDGLEILFDTMHNRGETRDSDDYKLFVNLDNAQASAQATQGSYPTAIPFTSSVALRGSLGEPSDVDDGYTLELAVPWETWGVAAPDAGVTWGFDVKFNDDHGDGTHSWISWRNTVDSVNSPDGWGQLLFVQ